MLDASSGMRQVTRFTKMSAELPKCFHEQNKRASSGQQHHEEETRILKRRGTRGEVEATA
jgi:hypothetical protein